MRYTPGRFRDCPWCHGRGCAACDSEAEKAFQRDMEHMTVETMPNDESSIPKLKEILRRRLGPRENEVSLIASATYVALDEESLNTPELANVVRAVKELGIRVATVEELERKESQ